MKPKHHTRRGFRNNYPSPREYGASFFKFLVEFQSGAFRRVEFTRAQNDPAFLKANRTQSTLTWIGHSSFLVQHAGLNFLTDPHLTRRTSPFSWAGPARLAPLGLDFPDLPKIDFVLVSHNHYDHLDHGTVTRLAREHDPLFVVPLGLKRWFERRGMPKVVELDWWQDAQAGAAKVTAVPVQHFSGRGAHDRDATLWCGFVAELGGRKIFFAGDTGYSKDFQDIAGRFDAMDLSLLPIGAYDPRGFMKPVHVDPEEAVRIHQDLNSNFSVAMHWGTFRLTLEPLDEPPQRLAAALRAAKIPADRFQVLQHGQTLSLPF